MHNSYKFKFDAEAMIMDLGGPKKAHLAMKEGGADIDVKAVQKMKARNVMQSDAIATLMMATARRGTPINPYDYLLEKTGDADGPYTS